MKSFIVTVAVTATVMTTCRTKEVIGFEYEYFVPYQPGFVITPKCFTDGGYAKQGSSCAPVWTHSSNTNREIVGCASTSLTKPDGSKNNLLPFIDKTIAPTPPFEGGDSSLWCSTVDKYNLAKTNPGSGRLQWGYCKCKQIGCTKDTQALMEETAKAMYLNMPKNARIRFNIMLEKASPYGPLPYLEGIPKAGTLRCEADGGLTKELKLCAPKWTFIPRTIRQGVKTVVEGCASLTEGTIIPREAQINASLSYTDETKWCSTNETYDIRKLSSNKRWGYCSCLTSGEVASVQAMIATYNGLLDDSKSVFLDYETYSSGDERRLSDVPSDYCFAAGGMLKPSQYMSTCPDNWVFKTKNGPVNMKGCVDMATGIKPFMDGSQVQAFKNSTSWCPLVKKYDPKSKRTKTSWGYCACNNLGCTSDTDAELRSIADVLRTGPYGSASADKVKQMLNTKAKSFFLDVESELCDTDGGGTKKNVQCLESWSYTNAKGVTTPMTGCASVKDFPPQNSGAGKVPNQPQLQSTNRTTWCATVEEYSIIDTPNNWGFCSCLSQEVKATANGILAALAPISTHF